MVFLNGFQGSEFSFDHRTHEADQVKRRFCQVDFPSKQSDPGSKFFALTHQLKSIPGGSLASSKDSNDQPFRIVAASSSMALGRCKAFSETKAALYGLSRRGISDAVIDIGRNLFFRNSNIDLRIEDF